MTDPRKVALLVDVENVYLGLRNMYNRELGPELLIEKARVRGEVTKLIAFADWKEMPEGLADKFKPFGFETVQVDRVVHSRELGGKRREVVKDMVPLEMLAGLVNVLMDASAGTGDDIGTVVLASGEKAIHPIAKIAKERFSKDVVVCAIPGSLAKELETAGVTIDLIEVPPLAPVDEDGLSKLVPLMEELERRKRYLNFKYIRESVVRHGELKAKTFDEAERLLSDAIACGLVLKQKVEDKYHPGQLFTAYALNRDSALWKKYGNGLPAPVRIDGEDGDIDAPDAASRAAAEPVLEGERPVEASASEASSAPEVPAALGAPAPAPAVPAFAASSSSERSGGERADPRDGDGRERRGRRGRRGRGGDRGERSDRPERGGDRPERSDRPERTEAPREEREPVRAERSDRGDQPRGDDRGRERDDRTRERDDRGRDDRGRDDRGRDDRGRDDRGGRDRDRGRSQGRNRGQPARAGSSGGDKRGGRPPRPNRDPNRRFESASRLFREPTTPVLNDDEVDEERILRARGDLGGGRVVD